MQEHRTAGKAAERLQDAGYEVTTGVGGTGVVGLLANGDGPDGDAARRHGRAAGQGGDRAALRQHRDRDRRRRRTRCRSCTPAGTTCTSPGWPGRPRCSPPRATPGSGTVLAVFQPAEETAAGRAGDDRRRPLRPLPQAARSSSASTSCPARRATSATGPAPRRPPPTASRSGCSAAARTARCPSPASTRS